MARGRGRLYSKSLPLPLASPTPVKNTGVGDGWINVFRFPKVFFSKSTFGAVWRAERHDLSRRVSFCQAFSFAPLAPKEKADNSSLLFHGQSRTLSEK